MVVINLPEKIITADELNQMIEVLGPLLCWRVGLSYGSMIYFEMGDKVEEKALDGSIRTIGSSSLSLLEDEWSICENGGEIISWQEISRNFVESTLDNKFVNKRLLGFQLDSREGKLHVCYSGKLELVLSFPNTSDETEDVINLFLPNGQIVALNKQNGLFIYEEISVKRQKHWNQQRGL